MSSNFDHNFMKFAHNVSCQMSSLSWIMVKIALRFGSYCPLFVKKRTVYIISQVNQVNLIRTL